MWPPASFAECKKAAFYRGRVWVPKGRDAGAVPLPEEVRGLAESAERLFPIPLLLPPELSKRRSHGTRRRKALQVDAWREANRLLMTLNSLRKVAPSRHITRRPKPG